MIWKVKVFNVLTRDIVKEMNEICKDGWEPFHIDDSGDYSYTNVYFKKLKAVKK
jgi:hypothetical protein